MCGLNIKCYIVILHLYVFLQDHDACVRAIAELNNLNLNQNTLKKTPEIMLTIKRVSNLFYMHFLCSQYLNMYKRSHFLIFSIRCFAAMELRLGNVKYCVLNVAVSKLQGKHRSQRKSR